MSDLAAPMPQPAQSSTSGEERQGLLLVFLSALAWSFGGTIGRFVETPDGWTMVFWRSFWAVAFLVGFMLWRDGRRGTLRMFAGMGVPGMAVAICFGISSACFVLALSYTTVANILLMQAGVPLIAALISWVIFRERIAWTTWMAICAVILGIGIMVSESATGAVSPIGDALALLIAICFAIATVITRRYAHVRMTPATCLGAALAGLVAAFQSSGLITSVPDAMILFVFGALNLGLGFAFFAMGARLVPAVLAALMGTFEPVLGPVWVWLVHGEVPSASTMIGGTVVVLALVAYLGLEFRRYSLPRKPGVTGMPNPN
ncbi:DMT family transporter [Oryzicola mucosus]|uniref:DMT family transporter n=1 Tax=Oryzicola mucosus TaxID=2767425 RepID=A0A8J6TWY0_9HYPH|nr:DMT family transporter [Oryzicola mucosus]